MIGVSVRSMVSNSTVSAVDAARREDCSGLVMCRDDSTNTGHTVDFTRSVLTPTRVDRTIDYALSRYDNLLRRLAD